MQSMKYNISISLDCDDEQQARIVLNKILREQRILLERVKVIYSQDRYKKYHINKDESLGEG